MVFLINAVLVGTARLGWADGKGLTRRPDSGAVKENGAPEEVRSDAAEVGYFGLFLYDAAIKSKIVRRRAA